MHATFSLRLFFCIQRNHFFYGYVGECSNSKWPGFCLCLVRSSLPLQLQIWLQCWCCSITMSNNNNGNSNDVGSKRISMLLMCNCRSPFWPNHYHVRVDISQIWLNMNMHNFIRNMHFLCVCMPHTVAMATNVPRSFRFIFRWCAVSWPFVNGLPAVIVKYAHCAFVHFFFLRLSLSVFFFSLSASCYRCENNPSVFRIYSILNLFHFLVHDFGYTSADAAAAASVVVLVDVLISFIHFVFHCVCFQSELLDLSFLYRIKTKPGE